MKVGDLPEELLGLLKVGNSRLNVDATLERFERCQSGENISHNTVAARSMKRECVRFRYSGAFVKFLSQHTMGSV